jgi:hypothetical protein
VPAGVFVVTSGSASVLLMRCGMLKKRRAVDGNVA